MAETKGSKEQSRMGLIIMVIVGIILFATNPTERQFKEYLQEDLKAQAKEEDELTGAVMEAIAKPAAWVVGLTTDRKNFYIFSIYRVTVFGEEITYVGALNHFFRLG